MGGRGCEVTSPMSKADTFLRSEEPVCLGPVLLALPIRVLHI